MATSANSSKGRPTVYSWQFLALPSVIERPIFAVYPDISSAWAIKLACRGYFYLRKLFQGTLPTLPSLDSIKNDIIFVMWTRTDRAPLVGWVPNHFVLLQRPAPIHQVRVMPQFLLVINHHSLTVPPIGLHQTEKQLGRNQKIRRLPKSEQHLKHQTGKNHHILKHQKNERRLANLPGTKQQIPNLLVIDRTLRNLPRRNHQILNLLKSDCPLRNLFRINHLIRNLRKSERLLSNLPHRNHPFLNLLNSKRLLRNLPSRKQTIPNLPIMEQHLHLSIRQTEVLVKRYILGFCLTHECGENRGVPKLKKRLQPR